MPLPLAVGIILRQRRSLPRYSVRVLLTDLKFTGEYFIHVRPENEGGSVEYNPKNRQVHPSAIDRLIALLLRDGTHIIFPFHLDESTESNESSEGGPPSLDSDGNAVDIDESTDSDELSQFPPSFELRMILPDGTHIIVPFDRNESTESDESNGGPPSFEYEYPVHLDESTDSDELSEG
jgi:hypothetical protein